MEPENTGRDGGEELARGVARTINARADRYLRARHAHPLSFGPIALRLTRERRQRRTRYIAFTTVSLAAVAAVARDLGSAETGRGSRAADVDLHG